MVVAPTKKGLQRSANILVISAIGVAVLAALLYPLLGGTTGVVVFLLLRLLIAVLFVMGCMKYALSKGYPQLMGLLGLLTCVGLIILVVLPDKWVDAAPPVDSPTNYPRYPQG